jgi:glycosyltransferase involved in cell wall biosynthesis
LKVAYVTMHFPAPSEPFAATDVRVLHSLGVEVDVFSLMRPHRRHNELIQERGLLGIGIRPMTFGRIARGMWLALARAPSTALWLGGIIARTWRRPAHLIKSLALVPGAVTIVADLERGTYDVVHLFWGHYPAMVGRLVMQRRDRPLVSMFLGAYDLQTRYGPSRDLARRASLVFTHAAVNVDDIVAQGVSRERIRVVYRGVPPALIERGRAAPSEGRDPAGIVTASRFIPSKRVEDVIAVFAEVAKSWPTATLNVLGDGPERARLADLVAQLGLGERVRFAGHLPHQAVFAELRRASAFLLLSAKNDERLPNVVKEAMACGCVPIVATTPGIDELVDDGVSGFIVPAGRLDLAAERVGRVLHGGAEVERVRQRAQRRIERAFDARLSMLAYVAAWHEAAEPRVAPPAADPRHEVASA